jgi:hypothetical protein
MHYLSSLYFFNQPLHVSSIFITHHQEVFTVYVQQLVRVIRCWPGQECQPDPTSCQSPKPITRTNYCIYTVNTSWWWAINTPETCVFDWRNKLRIYSASVWFSIQTLSIYTAKNTQKVELISTIKLTLQRKHTRPHYKDQLANIVRSDVFWAFSVVFTPPTWRRDLCAEFSTFRRNLAP